MISVYLAGHIHTKWRKDVIAIVNSDKINWLQPFDDHEYSHNMGPEIYTIRDLVLVRKADIVFAYLQKRIDSINRYVGTSAEIGLAKGLGKTIILVNELREIHSFDFLEQLADSAFEDLEKGLATLKYIVKA